jgi:hypothetical protein
MENSDLIMIGGLWLNESQSGNKYMSGSLGMAKLLVFKNNNKRTSDSPDYFMYVAPKEQEQRHDDEQDEGDIPF